MLFWSDFEKRVTKVMCSKCQADISEAVEKALGPHPDARKIVGLGNNLETLARQSVFHYKGSKYVFMKFNIADGEVPPNQGLIKILKGVYKSLTA